MIKEILKPEKCAECKGCCFFGKEDIWEVPLIMPQLAERIKADYPSVELTERDGVYTFKIPTDLNGDALYVCPLLTDKGCALGDKKPFDCAVYPFRVMRDKDGAVKIASANYCKGISGMSREEMYEYLRSSGLYDKIMEYKDANPAAVLDYTDDYTIIG